MPALAQPAGGYRARARCTTAWSARGRRLQRCATTLRRRPASGARPSHPCVCSAGRAAPRACAGLSSRPTPRQDRALKSFPRARRSRRRSARARARCGGPGTCRPRREVPRSGGGRARRSWQWWGRACRRPVLGAVARASTWAFLRRRLAALAARACLVSWALFCAAGSCGAVGALAARGSGSGGAARAAAALLVAFARVTTRAFAPQAGRPRRTRAPRHSGHFAP
jgi:hypothetical protein